MKTATLSVAIATYNEAEFLADCLKSVKDLASEIIIVDGSSTDDTVKIAKKFTAKVTVTTNKPIFHINKNLAIKQCRHDWILQLDADERLTPALTQEIKQVLSGNYHGFTDWHATTPWTDTPPTAFWLKRRNFFLTRYLTKTGQYPDPVIRLFKHGTAKLPAKDVHEQLKVKGQVAWLKSDLDHYATPYFRRYLERENRYSSLLAQQLYDQKLTINPLSFINYMFFKPCLTFTLIYFRHQGFRDQFPGFVFSLFSALHFPLAYIKLWELIRIK